MSWVKTRVVACDQVSWFQQRHRVYAYHDTYGYLMELSPDLLGVFQAFAAPTTPYDVIFGAPLPDPAPHHPPDLLEEVIQTWIQHDILVPPVWDWRKRIESFYPVRARWHVVHECDDRRVAIVGRNIATPPRALQLSAEEAQIWGLLDGDRSILDIASEIDGRSTPKSVTLRAVQDAISAWTHSDLQLTRLSRAPMRFYSASKPPAYLISAMPYARITPETPLSWSDPDKTDLHDYHTDVIDDAQHQFDDVETTLAHLFRLPTPFLGGLTYGETFADTLIARDLITNNTRDVLEVGGGIGVFARAVLDRIQNTHADLYEQLTYTVLDLSPALHRSQTEQLHAHTRAHTRLGDALDMPIPDNSVDLLISNEVIADLPCQILRRTQPRPLEQTYSDPDAWLRALEDDEEGDENDGRDHERNLRDPWDGPDDVLKLLERYNVTLDDAPASVLINIGALRFLIDIDRVLKPGGAAIVTEFGHPYAYPREADHLDHPEVSIHFRLLIRVAQHLGFHATLVPLPDLLPFALTLPSIASTRTYWRNLRHLASLHGATLPKIAYTPDSFADQLAPHLSADTIHAKHFHPLSERTHGLGPHDFYALILRTPPQP